MAIIYNPTNIKSDYYCYIHKRKDGTPFYVGKGKYYRAINVSSAKRNNWHKNIVYKEGADNIIIELIPALDEKDAFRLEALIIASLRQYFMLCNFTDGGEGRSGYKMTDKQKKLVSITHKGKTISIETRAKISKSKKGIQHSEESKLKLSIARKGMILTEAHKKAISKSKSGENSSTAKITWDIAKRIRENYYIFKVSQVELASWFNVSRYIVMDIIHNISWKEN